MSQQGPNTTLSGEHDPNKDSSRPELGWSVNTQRSNDTDDENKNGDKEDKKTTTAFFLVVVGCLLCALIGRAVTYARKSHQALFVFIVFRIVMATIGWGFLFGYEALVVSKTTQSIPRAFW